MTSTSSTNGVFWCSSCSTFFKTAKAVKAHKGHNKRGKASCASAWKSKMKANPDFARNLIAALVNAQNAEGGKLFQILSGNKPDACANGNAGGSAN